MCVFMCKNVTHQYNKCDKSYRPFILITIRMPWVWKLAYGQKNTHHVI